MFDSAYIIIALIIAAVFLLKSDISNQAKLVLVILITVALLWYEQPDWMFRWMDQIKSLFRTAISAMIIF